MGWWENTLISIPVAIILLLILLWFYIFHLRRKNPSGKEKKQKQQAQKEEKTGAVEENQIIRRTEEEQPEADKPEKSILAGESEQIDQILNPDISLVQEVILNPSDEAVLLILPEHVPADEVKSFEEYLKTVDKLKIITTGGSSDEGSNIGVRVLEQVNLVEALEKSNMAVMKHTHKKGERIILLLK